MREFELRELASWKCPVCGCRNKIHTQFIHPVTEEFVGYSMKCCACGHYMEFFNEHKTNGIKSKPAYKSGKQMCVQRSFCPHKDCKLYGKFCLSKPHHCPDDHNHHHPHHQELIVDKVVYGIVQEPKFK